ncbi:TetR/AcrR family transcriptional regulator [Pseudonocardia sp. TRM90224]|uniref:TetR/AcrR family transcriptional regulator n=1 Tax=Pseudonocardia sp. TRM90224 TaxID=2812678 RepID=UPI001E54F6C5|nr:TetR/AcrR family transcriptional regulator [Pseudonocardia sp. TRM90224]
MRATPRRADARRNIARVLDAALSAFEEAGPDVPLDEIARRAGVGIATLYRLFGGRGALVRAVFGQLFEKQVEPLVATARAAADPVDGLVEALTATVEVLMAHQQLLAALREAGGVSFDVAERYLLPLAEVLTAAQREGLLRRDLEMRDLAAVVVMVLATVHLPIGHTPHRRYIALLIAGMRTKEGTLPPLD